MRIDRKLALVAVGGNAILPKTEEGFHREQCAHAADVARALVPLIRAGYRIVLTHGNGPQVGLLLIKNEVAAAKVPTMPLDVLVADTQGAIGYRFYLAIQNVMRRLRPRRPVVVINSYVEVDPKDPAFRHPTKPVGPFVSAERSRQLRRQGYEMVEELGRGWRRVVPSPRPRRLLDVEPVRAALRAGALVITGGGGGVPVMRRKDGSITGVEAVIDKDRSSAMLAAELGAGVFVVLMGERRIMLDFGRPTQRPVDRLTLREARRHARAGQFPPGSLGPKVEAAMHYVQKVGGQALITDLSSLAEARNGGGGTWIVKD